MLSVGGRGAAAAVRPAAVLGQTAVWWCGYNRAWYKRAKLGAGRCEGKSACLVLQLCSLCARRGICALRLCTWLSRCRRRCARRVLSRLNTFYTRSTSPLPMASSHSGPHVYPASLQHRSIQRCRRVFRQQLVSIVWLVCNLRRRLPEKSSWWASTGHAECTWSVYQQISTSGSGVCNISSYILLVTMLVCHHFIILSPELPQV